MYINELNRNRNIKISNIQKNTDGCFYVLARECNNKKNEQLCKGGVCI